jgi:RHS repeat-associated protein
LSGTILRDAYTRTGDSGLKYSATADSVRQKFTGYQKDQETNLDFAEARMYENRHGRFTAVDPLLASGKSANPQTFNRFAYVLGNPLKLTDKTGLQVGGDLWSLYFSPDVIYVWCRAYDTTTYTYNGQSTTVRTPALNGLPSVNDDWDFRLVYVRHPPPSITDEDVEGAVKGLKELTNLPFKFPLDPTPGIGPSPTISRVTGFQPFSDEETRTTTWRQWWASQGTQLLAGGALGKIGGGLVKGEAVATDVISTGQGILDTVSARLAQNPGLARSVLSESEYLAGQSSAQVARMQYGNAVERLFWREVGASPEYRSMFQRVGGSAAPDGIAGDGILFDITTRNPITVQRHFARPYGQQLKLFQYDRPESFTLLP